MRLTTLPKAVLFDMDGTLTAPMLDFPRIRAEMGLEEFADPLAALAEMDEIARHRAEKVLLEHEEKAARQSSLNPGCLDLLRLIRRLELRTALITRNSLTSVETVCRLHQLKFDCVITREDCKCKPDPEPLLLACRRLEVVPDQAWMVGDGAYDIEAGRAAGIATVWVSHGRDPRFDAGPTAVVRDLRELSTLLDRCARG